MAGINYKTELYHPLQDSTVSRPPKTDTAKAIVKTSLKTTPAIKHNIKISQEFTVNDAQQSKTSFIKKGYDHEKPTYLSNIDKEEDSFSSPFIKPFNQNIKLPRVPIFSNDSLATSDSSDIAYKEYLLQNPPSYYGKLGTNNYFKADWMLGIVLLSFILLTWVKLFYNKYLTQIIQSLVNYQLAYKMFRDKNVLFIRISSVLNSVFILVTGLYLLLLLEYFNLEVFHHSRILNYALVSGCILLFSVLQYVLLKMTGTIFYRQREMNEYLHSIFVSNKSIGIFLLPVVIGLIYMDQIVAKTLIFTGILIIITLYLWRFIRGIKIIFKKDIFYFYLILYFCTLEILPVLLLFKYLRGIIKAGGF